MTSEAMLGNGDARTQQSEKMRWPCCGIIVIGDDVHTVARPARESRGPAIVLLGEF